MIAGLDIGASTTKGVLLKGSEILHRYSMQTSDAASSASGTLENLLTEARGRNVIDLVAVSGGGSRKIDDTLLGVPVKKVDEIKAIGSGGLMLAKKRAGLIVSVGTGTAMVATYDLGTRVNHVGGTGVGGGTILGLSKKMLGIDDFAVLETMASKGDPRKVDLSVADIVGGPVGIVTGDATASNFGRLDGEAQGCDIASGIFNMVSQVIGVLAAMAAKAYDFEDDVIFVGRLVRSKLVSKIIHETTELLGVKAHIPEDCEYCTAVGAARYFLLSEGYPRCPFK